MCYPSFREVLTFWGREGVGGQKNNQSMSKKTSIQSVRTQSTKIKGGSQIMTVSIKKKTKRSYKKKEGTTVLVLGQSTFSRAGGKVLSNEQLASQGVETGKHLLWAVGAKRGWLN